MNYYAQCRNLNIMLSVAWQSVIMLSVVHIQIMMLFEILSIFVDPLSIFKHSFLCQDKYTQMRERKKMEKDKKGV